MASSAVHQSPALGISLRTFAKVLPSIACRRKCDPVVPSAPSAHFTSSLTFFWSNFAYHMCFITFVQFLIGLCFSTFLTTVDCTPLVYIRRQFRGYALSWMAVLHGTGVVDHFASFLLYLALASRCLVGLSLWRSANFCAAPRRSQLLLYPYYLFSFVPMEVSPFLQASGLYLLRPDLHLADPGTRRRSDIHSG